MADRAGVSWDSVIARAVILLAATASVGLGQARYIGARACGACHPREFASQSATGHALALSRAAQHSLAKAFATAGTLRREPGYRFQFRWENSELRVRASDDADIVDIPVDWAFGAGLQAVTFVSRLGPEWYLELYFSYYSRAARMAAAPGHRELPAPSLQAAMGLPYKAGDPKVGIIGCFECHSTGPVHDTPNGFEPTESGVRCEACHGPGSAHRDAPRSTGRVRVEQRALRNPGRLSTAELNRFCGKCHRPPSSGSAAIDWSEPWNVRHQPPYLEQSACFRKSEGRLSCLTCHNPHEPLRQDAASYTAKCAGCHTDRHNPPRSACTGECTTCHMPAVSPQAYLRFTNHRIGVYGEGARLRPKK